jgi:hypothetical protein
MDSRLENLCLQQRIAPVQQQLGVFAVAERQRPTAMHQPLQFVDKTHFAAKFFFAVFLFFHNRKGGSIRSGGALPAPGRSAAS